jgi:hypothetical protein
MMETKTVHAEIKQAGDEGSFEAVIATLGVVDHDGDIVERGALAGKTASIVPAHQQHMMPLGKVKIEERGDEVIAVGLFNLETSSGKDWHAALRFDLAHPPSVQEWSWGYMPTESKEDTLDGKRVRRLMDVDLMEVSPVLRGASVGSRTIGVKSISPRHETETSEAPWREPKEAKDGAFACARKRLFAHHFCDDEGEPGPASTRACLEGIASLKGVRGIMTLAEDERAAIYAHLAGHLEDAGIEPPSLAPGLKLLHQVRLATYEAEAAIERVRDVSASRGAQGKGLSDEVKAAALELAAMVDEMARLSHQCSLLADHCTPQDAVSKALAAWTAHRARSILA